jgi:ATP-binding cassette, subfamily B, bacterial
MLTTDFPVYRQNNLMDCGPACLRMIARFYGGEYRSDFINKITNLDINTGVTLLDISQAAEEIGFETISVKVTLEKLTLEAPLPCILHWRGCHFVVLYNIQNSVSVGKRKYFIVDPAFGKLELSETDFAMHWLSSQGGEDESLIMNGIALLLQVTSSFHHNTLSPLKDSFGLER